MGYRLGVVCARGLPVSAGGRERNEDSFLLCHKGRGRYQHDEVTHEMEVDGDGTLLGVFDGLGGHDDGHVASSTAARVLAKLYQPGSPANPTRVLLQFVRNSQETLYLRARGADGRVRMGTTLTVAWLLRGLLHWVHVGDSRLYVGSDQGLTRLTDDHTRNLFRRRDGQAQEPGGEHLAQSFIYGSRGFGHDAQLRIEVGKDTGARPLDPGDRVLLCTDGLTRAVSDARIHALLMASEDPQQIAESLLAAALAARSPDNVTALVAIVDQVPDEDLLVWSDDGEETVQF